MRTLVTARLVLEPQVTAHAEPMYALLQDPAIYRYENEPPESVDWLRERFRRLESRTSADGSEQWLNWVVRLRDSDLIGYVQATACEALPAAIAYVFASRWWGHGYASEAVVAMMEELAESYGARAFSAVLKRDNLRSVRLLERLGFEQADEQMRIACDTDEIAMLRAA
ncbi:MAG TPA: GNAT family N-acetyltransferase [Casimicrobiaceae bacterium]|nr:GNAT family N-acetyltransferase [Casimicrobiaceae bacterium]